MVLIFWLDVTHEETFSSIQPSLIGIYLSESLSWTTKEQYIVCLEVKFSTDIVIKTSVLTKLASHLQMFQKMLLQSNDYN